MSITIVRLPVFFGNKEILDSLILLGLLSCVGWGALRQHRGSFSSVPAMIAFLYAGVIGVALFRGADARAYGSITSATSQTITYLLFVALGIILMTTARDKRERDQRLLAIALAPAVYVVINALVHFVGVPTPVTPGTSAPGPAELLKFLHINSERTKFPLATSINLFSIIVAAALASIVVVRLRAPSLISRRIAWPIFIACLYCVLLGDSRGALVIAIVVILLFAVKIRIPPIAVAGIVPVLPLLVIGVIALISGTHLNNTLSRGAGQFQEVATATGRLFIWKGSWEVLKHFSVQQLYGWGAAGHLTSGASLHYAFVFAGNPEADAIFTHDIVLQMIFDTGYVGLALLMLAVWSTWRQLQNYLDDNLRSPAIALLPILLVVLLSGATEVSPTYYSQEALLAVLLIMGAASGLPLSTRSTVHIRDSVGLSESSKAAQRPLREPMVT